jgi:hypothetical protein
MASTADRVTRVAADLLDSAAVEGGAEIVPLCERADQSLHPTKEPVAVLRKIGKQRRVRRGDFGR